MLIHGFRDAICCPQCFGDLNDYVGQADSVLLCSSCSVFYPKLGDTYTFLQNLEEGSVARTDPLDRIKSIIKLFPRLYSALIFLISPVYWNRSQLKRLVHHIETRGGLALNLGSGASSLSNQILNVDYSKFKNVDIVADINKLPFKNATIDYAISVAVLEHTPNPNASVAEMERVLKPGGTALCVFPFIQGFHASPHDYSRVTEEGLKNLFTNFTVVSIDKIGPTSGMLWIFQEWISSCLSCGNRHLHNFLLIFLMLLTWPVKFLDIFLSSPKTINNVPSAYVLIAKKK